MSTREGKYEHPGGPTSAEVRQAVRALAGTTHGGDPVKIRRARRAYWLVLAEDMRRRAEIIERRARELERAETAERKQELEQELRQLEEVS